MYMKIENGAVVLPPKNDPETGAFNVHLSPEWLSSHGFEDWTDERLADWREENVAPSARIFRYSKLKLIAALKRRSLWETVKAAIVANGYEDEWQACQELSSDHPDWDDIINGFKVFVPAEEVDAILAEARI